jgi:WD40 repeat protein
LRSFKGHTNSVYSVAFSPDGRTALSGGGELNQPVGELKLWDVESGRELCSFMGSGSVGSIAFAPGGRFALSSSNHETLKLWDVASGRELHSFTGDHGDVESVAVSPDGRFALSGGWGNMKLWDISEWTQPPAASAAK